jgi:hypothetical protein
VCADTDPVESTLGLGWRRPSHTVEEGVQLRQLKLDGDERGVHLEFPLDEGAIEIRRRRLERDRTRLALMVHACKLGEASVDGGLVHGKAASDLLPDLLHKLLHQQLDVRIYCTELLLLTGVVVVMILQGVAGSVV